MPQREDLTQLKIVLHRDRQGEESLYPPFIAHRSLSRKVRLCIPGRNGNIPPPNPLTILPIISRQDSWPSCRTAQNPALLRQWLDPVSVAYSTGFEAVTLGLGTCRYRDSC